MARIDAFLQLGREQGCSDIHLAVGIPPMVRLYGELVPIRYRELGVDELARLVAEILTESQQEAFEAGEDLDFSYAPRDLGRFRVNVYRKATGIGAAFRVISSELPTLDSLGLPPIIERLTHYHQGLVLVTGATGTGKSTTLAAMLDHVNATRRYNIITLEDPIEYVHTSQRSLIVQREIGTHVESFAEGLHAALREDPDVILVGELRDPETIRMALTAAETGHLVLGTLHTTSATKTLERIVDAAPSEQKAQVTTSLAQILRGVVSQTLVRTPNGRSRKAVAEILLMTPAISHLLLTGKIFQIPMQLETGRAMGMQLMDQALLDAVQKKQIDPNEAFYLAQDKRRLQTYVTDPDVLLEESAAGREG